MLAVEGTSQCNTTRHGYWKWGYSTYPTRTLAWTLNSLDSVWSTVAKKNQFRFLRFPPNWNKDQGEYVSAVLWCDINQRLRSVRVCHPMWEIYLRCMGWKGEDNSSNDCKALWSYTHFLHYIKWGVLISPPHIMILWVLSWSLSPLTVKRIVKQSSTEA